MKDLWSPSLRPTYHLPTSRLTAGTCGHEEGCENRELLTACDDVPLILIESGHRCYKPSMTCLLCGACIFSTCTVHQVSLRSRRGGGHGWVVQGRRSANTTNGRLAIVLHWFANNQKYIWCFFGLHFPLPHCLKILQFHWLLFAAANVSCLSEKSWMDFRQV